MVTPPRPAATFPQRVGGPLADILVALAGTPDDASEIDSQLVTIAKLTADLVRRTATEELDKIREQVGDEFFYSEGRPDQSRALFEQVALADEFIEFLTIPAYEQLD